MTHTQEEKETDDSQLSIDDLNDRFGDDIESETDGAEDRPDETEAETHTDSDTDDGVNTVNGEVYEYICIATARDRARLADPVHATLAAADDEVDGRGLDSDKRSDLSSVVIRDDVDEERPIAVRGGALTWSVRPSREPVDDLIDIAVEIDIPICIVDSLVTFGDDVKAIRERLDQLLSAGVRVWILAEEIDINPSDDSGSAEQVLNVLDGLVSIGPDIARDSSVYDLRGRDVLVDDWSGRTPLGCEIDNGTLVPADEFDSIVDVLELAQARVNADSDDVGISKAEAARRLDVSPRTISRCLEERAVLYGLDE